jgi:hypothetical protein
MGIRNHRFTICEVLREIYHTAEDKRIKLLSRIAMTMAKKMNNKLFEYSPTWQEIFDGKSDELSKQIGREANGGDRIL